MRNVLFYLSIVVLACVTTSCMEEIAKDSEEKKFLRIYDHTEYNMSFKAIDVEQTPDGGYLVLARRNFEVSPGQFSNQGIYLLKADKYGHFVSDLSVDETYINPLDELTEINGNYYFICTSTEFFSAQIGMVTPDLAGVQFTAVNSIIYPAAVSVTNNAAKDFILLSYDPEEKESVVSIVDKDGVIKNFEGYTIGAGNQIADEKIIRSFMGTDNFPFQVGEVSPGLYFFNGFYEYSLSLAFVNLADDAPPIGVIQAEYDDVGFNRILPLGGASFATAQYNLGENYILPRTQLPSSGDANPIVFDGAYKLPEFATHADIRILRTQLAGKNILVYGSDTKSKQIGLLFYDEATGALTGARYLGFTNPFELGNVIKTADGGLAICGTTYIAGRFARLTIIKLSKGEAEKEVK